MEIKKVTEENLFDLFSPCGPNEEPYTTNKNLIVNLWKEKRFNSGWRGYIVYENQIPVGRVEIWPIESGLNSVVGENLYYMPCIWVLPEYQKKGIGKSLIETISNETKDKAGIVTIAMEGEDWMPISFFEKFGFQKIKELPFESHLLIKKHYEVPNPEILKPTFEHKKRDDKIVVEIVKDMFCPFMRVYEEKIIKVIEEYKDKVEIIVYEPQIREDVLKYGFSTVYIDGDEPFYGPVKSDEVRKIISQYLDKKGIK